MSAGNILVIDDERRMCLVLKAGLEVDGHHVEMAFNGDDGFRKLKISTFDVVITDLKMPGKDGLQLLDEIKKSSPATEVILMTAFATAQTAVEAMKKGAYDYVIKPFKMAEVKIKVKQIIEKKAITTENIQLKQKLKNRFSLTNIIGSSGSMQQIFQMVERVAPRDATVLIRGESGTGKELIANAVHLQSPRREEPLVAVNCGALPESLLESELFGHERGAFTGADKLKLGRFELAGAGTIFLDEIGDITPATQVKLLRVLQNKEIVRLGGTKTIKIRARTVAATNRNLEELLKQGAFREDLYYRINVFPILLPALRDRKEDIPALIESFLGKHNYTLDKLDKTVLKMLMQYSWPGNVRELENIIERLLILVGDDLITTKALPPHIYVGETNSLSLEIPDDGISLEEVEKGLIQKALAKAHGNKSKAAKLLGITRRKLYSMLERLG